MQSVCGTLSDFGGTYDSSSWQRNVKPLNKNLPRCEMLIQKRQRIVMVTEHSCMSEESFHDAEFTRSLRNELKTHSWSWSYLNPVPATDPSYYSLICCTCCEMKLKYKHCSTVKRWGNQTSLVQQIQNLPKKADNYLHFQHFIVEKNKHLPSEFHVYLFIYYQS